MNKEIGLTDEEKRGLIESSRLVEILTSRGIDLGKTPKRTLLYWKEQGLLPKPIRIGSKLGTKAYYPTEMIQIITSIRTLQENGLSLSVIKETLNTLILKSKVIDKAAKRHGIEFNVSDNLLDALFEVGIKVGQEKAEKEAEKGNYSDIDFLKKQGSIYRMVNIKDQKKGKSRIKKETNK